MPPRRQKRRIRMTNAANALLDLSRRPVSNAPPVNTTNISPPISYMIARPHTWTPEGVTIGNRTFRPRNDTEITMFSSLRNLPVQIRRPITSKYLYDTRHKRAGFRHRYTSLNSVIDATVGNGTSGRALAEHLDIPVPGSGYKPHRHGAGLRQSVDEFMRTGTIRNRAAGLRKPVST
jgi:hypothetical protein